MNQLKKLLIIGFVWPEPKSSAAGERMMQLISIFKENGFEITFASAAQDSDFMIDLAEFGVIKRSIELNSSSFDDFIAVLNPDVVLFDRFMIEEQFGWRIIENCPKAIRILDTEDLHCLRTARQKAFKENRTFELIDLLSEEVAKREIASILRCDLSLIISEFEMNILEDVFKINKELLFYLPFLVDKMNEEELLKLPSFEDRKNFIFIGNFLHEPNWNTVQHLKESIWPSLKKNFPEAILEVYGAYPSQKVLQLHQPKNGFFIMGRAEDANEIVKKARIVLAPIRFGAGLKGKLLEAMQCGTPSITTSIGSEAMHLDLPWNGCIEDNPEVFAKKAIELYQDENLWKEAQKNGVEIINKCYQKQDYSDKLISFTNSLLIDSGSHRLHNFMGNLLQHHAFKSTMYMSKWIEAKNK
ncbi:glycosyltransferase family 4 protein [Flavobacterium quisquiliarum]|jgi:glycosyltransferase involved in cell wall biosynthesis|uniref:Glycosyltransferase family 4 protein n=1 Tax=Flavobacterium quisquiliarum TaxID=1834436 RepID=A0ABV8W4K9_9FLAO|nr:glycosyltransferase family 4 protein [Flavobacterium quisquiliarum]MBW1654422.1 glycosyltransferase [Flavobacterium quisquiliarum]NWL01146.1 glycosyltransferase [Flavobacterium collinsii]